MLDCWKAHSVAVFFCNSGQERKRKDWVLLNRKSEDHGSGMAWSAWLIAVGGLPQAMKKPLSLATDSPCSHSVMLNCICWDPFSLQFWRLPLIQDKYFLSPKYYKTTQYQHYTKEMKCHDSSISWPHFKLQCSLLQAYILTANFISLFNLLSVHKIKILSKITRPHTAWGG